MNLIFADNILISFAVQLMLLIVGYLILLRVFVPLVKSDKWNKRLMFYMPIAFKLLIGFLVVEVIIKAGVNHPLLTFVVVALIVAVTFNQLKEFCSGIIFMLQRGDVTNQKIEIDSVSGTVVRLNATKLALENDKGEIIQLPYSNILGEVEVRPSTSKQLKSCLIVQQVEMDQVEKLREKWLRKIALMPFVFVGSEPPRFELRNEEGLNYLRLTVFTNDEAYIPLIKEELKS